MSDLNGLLFLKIIFIISFEFIEQEFTQYYLNERLSFAKHISPSPLSSKDPLKVTPEAFDWRNLSAVTDVKNQVIRFNQNLSNKFSLFRVNVVHVGHLVSLEILKVFGKPKKVP